MDKFPAILLVMFVVLLLFKIDRDTDSIIDFIKSTVIPYPNHTGPLPDKITWEWATSLTALNTTSENLLRRDPSVTVSHHCPYTRHNRNTQYDVTIYSSMDEQKHWVFFA